MTLSAADALALLRRYEDPAHADLFFIGQADRRITFYSQQVRALELAHALSASGRLLDDDRIAIVGGGAAGLTAATALGVLGARVELFESSGRMLDPQFGSHRLLDPKIYEWPRPGSLDLDADLPFLDWRRANATVIRTNLLAGNANIEALIANLRPITRHFNSQIASVDKVAGNWRVTPLAGGAAHSFTKVIIAAGFGAEPTVGTAQAQAYWSANGPPDPGYAGARCMISGVGDGGLTDMMALLVEGFEHRSFTEEFLKLVSAAELASAVETADAAAVGAATLQSQYDLLVRPVLESWGVIEELAPKLIAGRSIVMNASNGSILVKGAASKLNQVMAYALQLAAIAQVPPQFAVASGRLSNVTDEPDGRKLVQGPVLPGGRPAGIFDLVIVRHGPKKVEHLGWLAGKFETYVAHRDGLIVFDPDSIEPPALRNDTYSFFHEKQDRFYQPAHILERAHTRALRANLIILQLDRATRVIVERGAMPLAIAIGGAGVGLEVHLANGPGAFGELQEALVRALRSAGNRVTVTCPPAERAAWSAFLPGIAPRAQLPVPYPAVPAPAADVLSQIVDAVLLAKLDHGLAAVWQTGVCEVGPVHQTIIAAIQPTWGVWLAALTDNPQLRSHVLQTLWAGEGGSSWDGNPGCLSRLTAALVLMLASSLGVGGLNPHIGGKQPNLAYGAGLAIGSACATMLGKQIDDCDDPNDWDANIIMLSEAVELDFALVESMRAAGGNPLLSLSGASRVAPALIKRSKRWRDKLARPLQEWLDEVVREINEFEARREAGLRTL